ncbi:hypothetical protein ANCDUO_11529 [Ancylostoma duodenale]|uniref:Uncharacterized protein n=1 Tax=Ancylostoma duodenale TaxID=51022 RepID=A0A0C2D7W7_9BILA|nr:hypothetical protein ANCDUO_11529 [Ancylostoma duodenale]
MSSLPQPDARGRLFGKVRELWPRPQLPPLPQQKTPVDCETSPQTLDPIHSRRRRLHRSCFLSTIHQQAALHNCHQRAAFHEPTTSRLRQHPFRRAAASSTSHGQSHPTSRTNPTGCRQSLVHILLLCMRFFVPSRREYHRADDAPRDLIHIKGPRRRGPPFGRHPY